METFIIIGVVIILLFTLATSFVAIVPAAREDQLDWSWFGFPGLTLLLVLAALIISLG